mgnify:CR=1 FL=1
MKTNVSQSSHIQRERILEILFNSKIGMTRNEINEETRMSDKEIKIQSLCRRIPELLDTGLIVYIEDRECSVTNAKNQVFRLSGRMRTVISRERAKTRKERAA